MNWTRVNDGLMQSGRYFVLKQIVRMAPEPDVITYIVLSLSTDGLCWLGGGESFKEAQAIVRKWAELDYSYA